MSPHIPDLTDLENNELDNLDPMQDILENKNLIFQAMLIGMILKLGKMEGGMKTIQVLGKSILDGLFKTTNALGKASAANYIAAWANPTLISGLFERFGMLPPRFNRGFHDAISKLTGITATESILDTLFGKEGAFPSSINFGSETTSEDKSSILDKALIEGIMAGGGAGAGAAAGGGAAAVPPVV